MRYVGYLLYGLGSLSLTLSAVGASERPEGSLATALLGAGLLGFGWAASLHHRHGYRGGSPTTLGALFLLVGYLALIAPMAGHLVHGEALAFSDDFAPPLTLGGLGFILLLSGHRLHRERMRVSGPSAPSAKADMLAGAGGMSGGDRRSAPEGRNGPASITAPLELRFGPSLLKRAHMMVLLGPVVVACAAALPVLLWNDDRSLADLLAAAWAALAEGSLSERVNGWAGVVLMPLGIVALVATRAARLRVSMTGLQGQLSPWSGAGIQKLTTGAFSIPWDRIESVSLISRGQGLNGIAHLNTARLIISTSDGEFTFAPFHWVARDDDHRLTLGEAFTGGRISASEWLARSPLVRSLRERGFEVEHDTGPRAEALTRGFDLARHRGMVVQMSLMALLGGYALIDGFATSPYRVLETLPAAAFAAAAIVGTALAAALGRGAPAKERMGVGILTVAALVSAVHPALVRVNAWTGTPRTVSYTVSAPGRLQAPGETFPDIDLTDMNIPEYWEAHSAGTEQPMTLVKGALGFEQWDERPLLERVRAFYVAKRRQESAATGEQGLQ